MSDPAVAFVVVGLNEGAHLPACFASLLEQGFERECCEPYVHFVDGDTRLHRGWHATR